ncbi:cornichon [Athelia psychrophila]|uniref:Cornichon n=1 Tax=Athelia psychrophila TaxID=1759441 RepID=A0A166I9A7_9AGAM|nr:cornichon [Fibularhizoctonia sp. CBS 109695]
MVIMLGTGCLFLFAVLMAAGPLLTMVFFIIMFSDLECDYISPTDLCNQLNQFVLPEMAAQAFLALLFLISRQWIAFLLNLPLIIFHARKRDTTSSRPASRRNIRNRSHTYDATEMYMYDATILDTLSGRKTESFVKLGFYLLSFFYYLYRMIVALIVQNQ